MVIQVPTMPDRDQNNREAEDHAREERIWLLRIEQEVLKGIERRQLVELEELRLTKEAMECRLTLYQRRVDTAKNRRDNNNGNDGAAN